MIEQSDIDTHTTEVGNFRSHLKTFATLLIESRQEGAAGLLLVLDEQVYRLHNRFMLGIAPPAAAAPPPPPKQPGKRAPKGQGKHRHAFDGAGKCACGAERQRAAKGTAKPVERPNSEARTIPLPGAGVEVRDNGDWR